MKNKAQGGALMEENREFALDSLDLRCLREDGEKSMACM